MREARHGGPSTRPRGSRECTRDRRQRADHRPAPPTGEAGSARLRARPAIMPRGKPRPSGAMGGTGRGVGEVVGSGARRARGSSTEPSPQVGHRAAAVLARDDGRQRHRFLGDGRLQHAAGSDPRRAAGAVRRRSGPVQPLGAAERPARPARDLPGGRRAHSRFAARPNTELDDQHRRARIAGEPVARVVVLGSARHRVRPHLPLQVAPVARAEAIRARDADRSAAVHDRHRRRADGAEHHQGGRLGAAVRPRAGDRRRLRDLAARQPRAACSSAWC